MKRVEKLAENVGGVNELIFAACDKIPRDELTERELSDAEMLDLMASEYTFIKRPVLVSGEIAIAGFSEKKYKEFLQ